MKPDYTDCVVRHRRELGHRMLEERQQNKYAAISYDKLTVNDQVYKYDDVNSSIVCIGKRQVTRQPRDNAHGQPVNNNIRRHVDRDTLSRIGRIRARGSWRQSSGWRASKRLDRARQRGRYRLGTRPRLGYTISDNIMEYSGLK